MCMYVIYTHTYCIKAHSSSVDEYTPDIIQQVLNRNEICSMLWIDGLQAGGQWGCDITSVCVSLESHLCVVRSCVLTSHYQLCSTSNFNKQRLMFSHITLKVRLLLSVIKWVNKTLESGWHCLLSPLLINFPPRLLLLSFYFSLALERFH